MWSFLEGLLYDNTIEEEYYRKIRQKSSSKSAVIVGLVAAVGGFLYGYDTGLINDLLEMRYVYENFPANNMSFTSHERALITAVLSLGTFFGALVAPLISDNYGRKFSIIISSGIIFNVGNILQIASTNVTLLCIGRAISGASVGILSAIVPLYQAEASPKWVRGSVVFTYQWAITWGLLIASAVCQGTRKIGNSGSYRIPVGLQFLWALILYSGMLFLPESPRYYVQKNKIQKALDSLSKLRKLPPDDPDLIEELVEIKANYDYELSFGATSYLDCFRNGGGRHKQILRMFTGIGAQLFQQCSGINFIFYYGVNFFSSTGINNYYIMSFVTYLVNTIFTIPGIILVETIGRRQLLLWGGVGMSVSNFIIAITGVSISNNETKSILSVCFSCVFIAFFASSWGGCVWALTSDIYGISIRQRAISITTATNWLVNFVFAYITPYLIDTGHHTAAIGNKIFFIWGGCNALGVLFVYFTVYETMGLKLEEIDYMYAHCKNARVSSDFKSTKIDFARLDENYNAVDSASPHESATTSSPPSKNEKDMSSSGGITDPINCGHNDFVPLYNSKLPTANTNGITIVPYNNIISPSLSSSSDSSTASSLLNTRNHHNSVSSTNNTIAAGRSVSTAGAGNSTTGASPSSDYLSYLESLKSEYSGAPHYTTNNNNSQTLHLSNTNPSTSHRGSVSNNGSISNASKIYTEKDLKSISDEYDLMMRSGTGNTTNNGNPTTDTTIIATPFFTRPPDSSDDEDE
ncbi:high-affinity glucose transporter [Scheffersomyces xylosifermentans]|uniref:high-affinity glucose transporter n=1 Tax=Scheffersomyces xylosifermentans TaxID=1304137 RepID=UPI00315C7D42